MSFDMASTAKLTPPFRLVATYFITSILFFLAGTVLTLINYSDFQGFYFQPHILAIVHTLALGWITMSISGAMYQLIPVVFRVRVYSIPLAYLQYFVLTAGSLGMIYGFYEFNISPGFVTFASIAFLGMIAFIINVLMSMAKVKEWNITAAHFLTGIVFLLVAVSIGLLLAMNLQYGFLMVNHLEILKVHAHAVLIGFVTMIIFGAVYQLVPMFSLSYNFPRGFGWAAYFLLLVGIVGYGLAITLGDNTELSDVFSLVMVAGVFAFLVQAAQIFRKRVRRKLDAGLRQTVVSFVYLGLAAFAVAASIALGPWKNTPSADIALSVGFLFFFGFIGSLILGQMLKIAPFLVWVRKYSSMVGLTDVPSLHEMVDQTLSYVQLYLWSAAVAVASGALVFSYMPLFLVGCSAMTISAIIYAYVQLKIFRS